MCIRDRYIDVEEWLSNPGYVDYICPQVYYGFENDTCPFAATVAEWNSPVSYTHLFPSGYQLGSEDPLRQELTHFTK